MQTEKNKAIVRAFNEECLNKRNKKAFGEFVSRECINHSAPAGSPNGSDGMIHFLFDTLLATFDELKVTILDQIAENDLVTTRKTFTVKFSRDFIGIPATGQTHVINVIDIIRLRDGKYIEHWGLSDLAQALGSV